MLSTLKRKKEGEQCLAAKRPHNHLGPCIALMMSHRSTCKENGRYCLYPRQYYPIEDGCSEFPSAINVHYNPRIGLMSGYQKIRRMTNLSRLPPDLLGICTSQAHRSTSKFRGVFFHVHQANFAATLRFIRNGIDYKKLHPLADELARHRRYITKADTHIKVAEFIDGTASPASFVAFRNRLDIVCTPPIGQTDSTWWCSRCFCPIPDPVHPFHNTAQRGFCLCSGGYDYSRNVCTWDLWDLRTCYYLYAFYPGKMLHLRPGMFLKNMTRRTLGHDAFRYDLHHHVFSHRLMHSFHGVRYYAT